MYQPEEMIGIHATVGNDVDVEKERQEGRGLCEYVSVCRCAVCAVCRLLGFRRIWCCREYIQFVSRIMFSTSSTRHMQLEKRDRDNDRERGVDNVPFLRGFLLLCSSLWPLSAC